MKTTTKNDNAETNATKDETATKIVQSTATEAAASIAPKAVEGNLIDALMAQIGARVVQRVSRTVLQQIDDVPFAVTFETAAVESALVTEGRGGKIKMEPARVCDVVNVATGASQTLIMNEVLEAELSRHYPELSYVGKSFVIRCFFPLDRETGKARRYRT